MTSESRSKSLIPCANGCGFFGRPETLNLCSKCYRDLRPDKQPALETTTHESSIHLTKSNEIVNVAAESNGDATMGWRCVACDKKLRLGSGFKCRCEGNFCTTHRYAEAHDCTFDYKTAWRDVIRKTNPLVWADKLERI